MAENGSKLGKGFEQQIDRDPLPEKADSDIKRQTGRPPRRPPYEQYLRVGEILK